ncbi:MAG: polysaccharide deacetylase family protein [Hyphomicrobium sp.]
MPRTAANKIAFIGFAACAVFASVVPAAAAGRELQSACFPPETLQAASGEEEAIKGDRRFSAPPSRTPVLAAEPVPAQLRGAIRRVEVPGGRKLIALTFDLCEDRSEVAGYDGRIIDTLRRENVKATLFAGGKWMRSHLTRTQQLMSDPLFEIANHAEAHHNLRLLDGDNLQDEILGPQRAYENIRKGLAQTQCAARLPDAMQSVAPRLTLFRFPYGACNPQALAAVNDAGLLAIQWDVSTGDPDPRTGPAALVRTMTQRVKPGSILIAHANGRGWHTAEALPLAIAALKKQGYEFVTVSELIAAGTPVIAATCYNNTPGDTDRYDHFQGLLAGRKPSLQPAWGSPGIFIAGPGPGSKSDSKLGPKPGKTKPPQSRTGGGDHGTKPPHEPF